MLIKQYYLLSSTIKAERLTKASTLYLNLQLLLLKVSNSFQSDV